MDYLKRRKILKVKKLWAKRRVMRQVFVDEDDEIMMYEIEL